MERDIWLHTELWVELQNLPTPTKDRLISALRAFAVYGPDDAGIISTSVCCDQSIYPKWNPFALRLYNFAQDPIDQSLLVYMRKNGRDITLLALMDTDVPDTAELQDAWDIFMQLETAEKDDGIRFHLADFYNNLPFDDLNRFETNVQQIYAATKGQRQLRQAQQNAMKHTADLLGFGPKWSHTLHMRMTYYLQQLEHNLAQKNTTLTVSLQKDNSPEILLPLTSLFQIPD